MESPSTTPKATSQAESFITIKVRNRAATLALLATVLLTAFKLGVAYLSQSVGVFSEGIHSALDLLSAAVAFFTIREAAKPADQEHPFGHGRFETLSALFESVLLIAASLIIVHEGIGHFQNPHPIQYAGLAILTILVSLVVSYAMFYHNRSAATLTESSALHVNALHFLTDVVASAGVLVGLVIMKITGWIIVDAVLALGVGAYIFMIAVSQAKIALFELTDSHLPESELKELREILKPYGQNNIDAHDLRTRKSGATRHIDFHLNLCRHMTVEQSHGVCDDMESDITKRFPTASVNIHVEPCGYHMNTDCHLTCDVYKKQVMAKKLERERADGN